MSDQIAVQRVFKEPSKILFRTKDGNETMRFSKLLIRLTGRNNKYYEFEII